MLASFAEAARWKFRRKPLALAIAVPKLNSHRIYRGHFRKIDMRKKIAFTLQAYVVQLPSLGSIFGCAPSLLACHVESTCNRYGVFQSPS